MTPPRVPLATYRLQFNPDFTLWDAIPILDYLRDLGISHVYASPILASRSGSGHGYDVTDPAHIDLDVGGEEAFAAFQAALEERGMGLLLDIVPNHMAASRENRWWMDVLEYGPDSAFASYFDIDWKPPSRILDGKLLLPFLGRPFAEVVNDGELKIRWQDGGFVLQYGEQVFPIAPSSYAEILRHGDTESRALLEAGSAVLQEWQGVVAVAQALANGKDGGSYVAAAAERRAKVENMRERLRLLVATSPEIGAVIENTLRVVNGTPGRAGSFRKLEQILSAQHYRLVYWQTASDTINYRRFFSITDLVCVRVEDPAVFDATHDLAIRMASRTGAGFRIDHIDGLRDPAAYLRRLSERLAPSSPEGEAPYVVVEKILARNEQLPEDWHVAGTTGYDFMNFANRLLVDETQAGALEDVYSRWTGLRAHFQDELYDKKKLVMRTLLGVEMRALGRELAELARDDRYARELHPTELVEALMEVTACLPVYRTYIQTLEVPETAKRILGAAIEAARGRRATFAAAHFDFLSDVLTLAAPEHVRPEQREARLAFVTRWQQFTGPIMAKGFEDTALYIYFPLASLNEVGGDPRVADTDPLAFHRFISARQKKWPNSMNATTTHDTKRSEDTRARIAVLSEMPDEWEAGLKTWTRMNENHVTKVNGTVVPDRNEGYFFYQTLIGVWPIHEHDWQSLVPRLQDYVIKAIREANVHTRWTRPNQAHESALREFVSRVADRQLNPEFCAAFGQFQKRTALYGMLNGLAQTLLKATCPGVPDCYQGSELWDLRLVDPDNRGKVDFETRRALLAVLRDDEGLGDKQQIEEMLASWCDGRAKMHVLRQALNARNEKRELFSKGDYQALEISGVHAHRVAAFARIHEGDWAIPIAVRCVASVRAPIAGADERREFWKDTSVKLPNGAPVRWVNVLAGKGAALITSRGGNLVLGDAFRDFPLALLLPWVE
jgi:(1->4)-alpha-D-glucan 1-alpha-D-glucosylmutase